MNFLIDLVTLVVWTGICCVLVYGLELFLGLFGYDASARTFDMQERKPPVTPEVPEE
jgi:hypothetical protein